MPGAPGQDGGLGLGNHVGAPRLAELLAQISCPTITSDGVLDSAHRLARAHLDSVARRRVGGTDPVGLRRELTDEGVDPVTVLEELAADANPGLVASAGPRYFGFVVGGSLPVALGADWLVSAWDQMCGMYSASPAVAVAEEVAAGWALDVLGLPSGASTGFTTGAQMANFTCLAAARGALLDAAGWDAEEPPVSIGLKTAVAGAP